MEEKKDLKSDKIDNSLEKISNKSNSIKDQNNNLNPLEFSSNIKDPSKSQFIPTNNGQLNKYNNSTEKSTIVSKKSHHRKKLRVNLTEDEEIYYYNLFESLDVKNIGKLDSREAATFMKKSGLLRNILKNIWLIASQKSINYIEREEFYVALRLIALAQNNLPYGIENIEKNSPIPPLANFKYKIKESEKIIYKISENNKLQYKRLFDNSKDNENDEKIISRKAINIWRSANASDDFIRKIASILTPLEQKGHFNLKEFQVGTYLCYINDKYEIPNKLPSILFNYLGRGKNDSNKCNFIGNDDKIDKNNNIDMKNNDMINKINLSKLNDEECLEYIKEAFKKAKDLNKENEIINKKIINAKNKISNLFEEIIGLEKEKDILKDKLNFICQGCSDLLDFIIKNKNIISPLNSYIGNNEKDKNNFPDSIEKFKNKNNEINNLFNENNIENNNNNRNEALLLYTNKHSLIDNSQINGNNISALDNAKNNIRNEIINNNLIQKSNQIENLNKEQNFSIKNNKDKKEEKENNLKNIFNEKRNSNVRIESIKESSTIDNGNINNTDNNKIYTEKCLDNKNEKLNSIKISFDSSKNIINESPENIKENENNNINNYKESIMSNNENKKSNENNKNYIIDNNNSNDNNINNIKNDNLLSDKITNKNNKNDINNNQSNSDNRNNIKNNIISNDNNNKNIINNNISKELSFNINENQKMENNQEDNCFNEQLNTFNNVDENKKQKEIKNYIDNKIENFNYIHNMDEFQIPIFDNNISEATSQMNENEKKEYEELAKKRQYLYNLMQMMNNRMIQSQNFNPNQINYNKIKENQNSETNKNPQKNNNINNNDNNMNINLDDKDLSKSNKLIENNSISNYNPNKNNEKNNQENNIFVERHEIKQSMENTNFITDTSIYKKDDKKIQINNKNEKESKDKDSINDNKICNDYSNIRIHTIIDIKKKSNNNNEQFKKNLDILQNDKHVLDNLFEEEDKEDINSNNFQFNFDKNLQFNDKDF